MEPMDTGERISARINLPSFALTQFFHEVIFNDKEFRLFFENPKHGLTKNGVKVDDAIDEDALMRLRFLVERLRLCVEAKEVTSESFERLFGVFGPDRSDLPPDIAYANQNSESNRGANTQWDKQDAVSKSGSDHNQTTRFDTLGIHDRFLRTPLLDIASLSRVMGELDLRLRDLGRF